MLYQQIDDGMRQPIDGGFVLDDEQNVGFWVGAYDTSRPLIIDPVLSYSARFGGGSAIAVDGEGNAYVTESAINNLPTTPSAFQRTPGGGLDAFVVKLNSTGTAIVYSTYLGGGRDDLAGGIAIDASGSVYLTGVTHSANFPTTPAPSGARSAPGELTHLCPNWTQPGRAWFTPRFWIAHSVDHLRWMQQATPM